MDNFDREKIPYLYQELFMKNRAGIAVLDHLWSQFVDTPETKPLDALNLAYRAGQRDVIRFIQLQRDRVERDQAAELKEAA
ncbi:MAG: hypothetical protein Q7T13_01620 [Polaromonas sp.]|nr:hypothetical protein [Polaromonas sp.]